MTRPTFPAVGLVPGIRTEPCVCGGCISAPADDWPAITEAVSIHNRSPEHQAWRLGWNLARHDGTWTPDGLGVRGMREAR